MFLHDLSTGFALQGHRKKKVTLHRSEELIRCSHLDFPARHHFEEQDLNRKLLVPFHPLAAVMCWEGRLLFISQIQIPNAPTETQQSPCQLFVRAVTGPKLSHFDRVHVWVTSDKVFPCEQEEYPPEEEEEELWFEAFPVLPELLLYKCSLLFMNK